VLPEDIKNDELLAYLNDNYKQPAANYSDLNIEGRVHARNIAAQIANQAAQPPGGRGSGNDQPTPKP
jgi:hypothetical protein